MWQNRPVITKPFPRSEQQMEVLSVEMISCHYILAQSWELQIPPAAAWISARAPVGTVISRHQPKQQQPRLWETPHATMPLTPFYRYYIQQSTGSLMPLGIIWHPYPVLRQHVQEAPDWGSGGRITQRNPMDFTDGWFRIYRYTSSTLLLFIKGKKK